MSKIRVVNKIIDSGLRVDKGFIAGIASKAWGHFYTR
jgi:hypothetical protein